MSYYQITTPGKWILTGEHAVTKGYPAIVFPLPSLGLRLEFFDGDRPLHIIADEVLSDACERALTRILPPEEWPRGSLHIQCTIPVASGLGSSAALCGALGNWLVAQNKISAAEMLSTCVEMENEFHGQSSGTDIAAVCSGKPIWFEKNKPLQPVELGWQPKIYLSHSGQSSSTSASIAKVETYRQNHLAASKAGEDIDQQMGNTAEMMKFALSQNEMLGLRSLAEAIEIACLCFDRWGLLPDFVRAEIQRLKEAGALAVKPTGSGDGGYLLSLWSSAPSSEHNSPNGGLIAGF